MAVDRGILDRLRAQGEEVLTQLSAEIVANPRLAKAVGSAMETAARGREMLEKAAARALGEVSASTRSELKRAHSRIEALEREVAELRSRARGTGAGKAKAAGRARARPGRRRGR